VTTVVTKTGRNALDAMRRTGIGPSTSTEIREGAVLRLITADSGWLCPIRALVSTIRFELVWRVFPGLAGVA
jgi:hypothetical protein